MSDYQITEHLGCFALTIKNQLIIQSTNRADCERVMTALEHRGHAERVLRSVRYNPETNSIEDS